MQAICATLSAIAYLGVHQHGRYLTEVKDEESVDVYCRYEPSREQFIILGLPIPS